MSDELIHYFYGFLYIFARCYGFLAFLPLGQVLASQGYKLPITLAFSLLFLPTCIQVPEISLLALLFEFLLGLTLLLPFLVLYEFVSGFGEIIDALRGQTIALQYNPLSESTESITAQLIRPLLWCSILQMGFFERSASILNRSFVQNTTTSSNAAPDQLITQLSNILSLLISSAGNALLIFLPIAAVMVAVDIFVVALQTALPQANLVNESFLVKSILSGLFFVMLCQHGFFYSWAMLANDLLEQTFNVIF